MVSPAATPFAALRDVPPLPLNGHCTTFLHVNKDPRQNDLITFGWHVPGAAKGVVSPAATPFAALRDVPPLPLNGHRTTFRHVNKDPRQNDLITFGWHVPGAAKGVVSPAATPFAALRDVPPLPLNGRCTTFLHVNKDPRQNNLITFGWHVPRAQRRAWFPRQPRPSLRQGRATPSAKRTLHDFPARQ